MKHKLFSFGVPSIIVAIIFTPLHFALGQSPSSIGGRTLELTITGGSFPFATSGKFRFIPSGVDSAYAVVPISGDVAPSAGTHTYTKTGANTAILSLVDSDSGPLTVGVTFNTPNSGTYSLTSSSFPGGSQSGTFILFSGESPDSIAGSTITVEITSGDFPFAEFGSYQILPISSGTYTVVPLSGDVDPSSGTYTYSKNSDYTGVFTFTDSLVGQGLSSQFSFASATSGTFLLLQAGGTGYQTAVFSMSLPVISPSINSHPESEAVFVGSSVVFSVSATGTEPLAYQWKKDDDDIVNANLATYTIANIQASDTGNYTVSVSNSGGTVTSNAAMLDVILIATEAPTFESPSWDPIDGFRVSLRGQDHTAFRIQWSADFVSWLDLTNFVSDGILSELQMPDISSEDIRMYRAVSP